MNDPVVARRLALAACAGALFTLALPGTVGAQAWPQKQPVRLVVPASAGGSLDLLTRPLAQKLTASLAQQVIVENRGGAGGMVGAEAVAKSAPDGYTFLMGAVHHAILPGVYRKVPYDSERDLAAVSLIATVPNVAVLAPTVPAATLAEFVAWAKANPRAANFGTGGAGTLHHLTGEIFKARAGVPMQAVHYKGSGPAITDLVAGQIQIMFETMPSALNQIRAGKLRPVAVTGARRAPQLPDVPTMAEAGFGPLEVTTWYGIFAPGGTPPEVVAAMSRAVGDALRSEEVRTVWQSAGAEGGDLSPAEFQRFWAAEIRRWTETARANGITLD
jgi:tripartite-type tricarboxylate transporter receptor subunit TctC